MPRLASHTYRIAAWAMRTVLPVLLSALILGWTPSAFAQEMSVQQLLDEAQNAGADVEQMRMVANRAKQKGLSSSATVALLRPAVDLSKQGLPASAYLTKSLEGLAKNVPLSRMRPVLSQMRSHTERAGEMVGAWTNRAEVRELLGHSESSGEQASNNRARAELITAITGAQQQDIPAQSIRGFLDQLPSAVDRRPIPMNAVATAVNILPELPGGASSPQASRKLLTAALNAGYSPESLRQLPAALRSARRASQQPPGVLVSGAAQAIARGTPAADVLQGLFQGSVPGVGPPSGRGAGPPGTGPGSGKPPGRGGKPPGSGPPDNPPGGGPPGNPGSNPPG